MGKRSFAYIRATQWNDLETSTIPTMWFYCFSNNSNLTIQPSTSKRPRLARPTELSEYQRSLLEAVQKTPDEDENFFMSLVPASKRLAPRTKARLKTKIMQLMEKAEFDPQGFLEED